MLDQPTTVADFKLLIQSAQVFASLLEPKKLQHEYYNFVALWGFGHSASCLRFRLYVNSLSADPTLNRAVFKSTVSLLNDRYDLDLKRDKKSALVARSEK